MVRAGLERHVEAGAGRVVPAPAAVLERRTLGVQAAELGVEALADHLAVTDEHGADQRVGADPPATALRELERSPEPSRFLLGPDRGHTPPSGGPWA
jgi:hypothetical protein